MQVAKNNFTSRDAEGIKGIIRKFTDIYLSIFKIERAFTKLPISRRRILIMLFLEELSPEEVAKRIGCSVNSVYLQRMRAIRELRKLITREDENEHK